MPRRKIYRLDLSQATPCFIRTPSGRIDYLLLRSSRRATIEVSVTDEEQIRVVAPVYVSLKVIERFLCERATWIMKRLQEVQGANQFAGHRAYETGQEFLFLGKLYPLYIQEGDCRRVKVAFDQHGWVMTIPAGWSCLQRHQKIKEALIKWYRQEAKEILGTRVFHFVRIMGLEPMTISVRTQKSVWGLCSYHDKSISFNWLLILAPIHVSDYVIVHELVHLTHPNHSKRFWNKVETFLPDYQERQDWLKNHRLEMRLPS